MKKRRETVENNFIIYRNNTVRITKESNELFFEIKNEITTDIAEAVSIMMKLGIKDVWNIEIDHNQNEVDPEKCLYWLSGGNKEWSLLEHYNKPWVECYLEFQTEFGFIVVEIIKRSKTLGDIKNGLNKYLNLPTLYDFAISKGFVK